jgi:hemerythrin-like domain-containing protein
MSSQPYEGATLDQLQNPLVRELLRVHDMFRNQLTAILQHLDDLYAGQGQLSAVETTIRTQSLIQAGTQYTQMLHGHHHGETDTLFPALLAEGLDPAIIHRLNAEHDELGAMIDQFNESIHHLATVEPAVMDTDMRRLAEALKAHLAYEETHVCPLLTRWTEWNLQH